MHDAILGEDNYVDGENATQLFQFAKNLEMGVKPLIPVTGETTIVEDDEDEECDEEGDQVGELPQAFGGAKKAADVESKAPTEVQMAHIIVLVDTSGSMRTVDVVSEDGSARLPRISAVTDSLRTFFEKQKEMPAWLQNFQDMLMNGTIPTKLSLPMPRVVRLQNFMLVFLGLLQLGALDLMLGICPGLCLSNAICMRQRKGVMPPLPSW